MIDARAARPALPVAAMLGVQALLLLWPATMGGQVFFRRDVHLMWHAGAEAYAQAWNEGSRPLWNPSVSFGQSLVADANHQVYYPLTPLHLVLRPWTYYTLYAFLHLWLAGMGMAFLGRRLGLGWLPAWATGALWMASGPLLSLVDTWNQLAGAAWMPWAIAAGLRTLSGAGMRAAIGWGGATAMQLLAGAPEMVLLALAGVAALAASRARRTHLEPRRSLRAGGWAAGAAVIALGLAACQWLPALDAARRAGRTALPREARTHWSIRPAHLLQAICPVPLHRLALTPRARQDLFDAPDPFLPSIYMGSVSAALAAAALARPSRPTIGLAAAAALSAVLAMGRHAWLYDGLVALAPPLQALRYPAKALLLASLAWCMLCGYGLAGMSDARRRRWLAIVAAVLALVTAAAAAVLAFGGTRILERYLAASGIVSGRALAWRMATAVLLFALASALALRRPARWIGAVLALALVDLALAHYDLNPTAPVALYTSRPPALQTALDPERGRLYAWDYVEPGASRRHLGREIPYLLARAPGVWDLRGAQALGLRHALFPPSASAWGVEGSFDRDVPGLEPAPLALLKNAFRGSPSAQDRLRLMRIAGVSRVAALHPGAGEGLRLLGRYDGYLVDPLFVFGVPEPRPRAFVVGAARVSPSDTESLAALLSPGFAPESEVILASGTGGVTPGFAGACRIRDRRADRVRIETDANASGWIVLTDAWDPGWRATVDGLETAVARANVAFRAVAIPAGRHQVEFVYRPALVATALRVSIVSLAALAACLGFAAVYEARRRASAA